MKKVEQSETTKSRSNPYKKMKKRFSHGYYDLRDENDFMYVDEGDIMKD